MLATAIEPSERRLSQVDLFCLQAPPARTSEPAPRARSIARTLGVVCVALLAGLVFTAWHANAAAQERDALLEQLRSERAERIRTALAAKDAELSAAHYALDTRVRRDIVDQRMLAQEQRENELERLAANVEQQKLVEADCVTPRSIMLGAGL